MVLHMAELEEKKVIRFIQLLPNTPPTMKFSDKDLPGSGKRLDILCRVLAACFNWGAPTSSSLEIEVKAILANERTLTFSNPKENMPIGEVAWGKEIREALSDNPPEFVQVEPLGLNGVLRSLLEESNSRVIALDETGEPITNSFFENTKAQNSFMLGDHRGFDSESLRIIRNENIQRISLGKRSYLSSHCVAALISKLERFGN